MYYLPTFNTANMTQRWAWRSWENDGYWGGSVPPVWVHCSQGLCVSRTAETAPQSSLQSVNFRKAMRGIFLLFNFFSQGDSEFLWPVIGCFTGIKSCWAVRAPFWDTGGDGQTVVLTIQFWTKRFYELFNFFSPCKINVITTPTIYTVVLV